MKFLFSRDIFFIAVFFILFSTTNISATQDEVAKPLQKKITTTQSASTNKNTTPPENKNQPTANIKNTQNKKEMSISDTIDVLEKTLPPIQLEIKLNAKNDQFTEEEHIVENHESPLLESYAGMVGDKRASKGLTLDLTMEQRGEGAWILCINGKEVENEKLVGSYLQINPSRFLIDVNTGALRDKVVNFTYQMPRDIRLKYGNQIKGYRIAIELPEGTKIVNKKVLKNEISIKFINQTIIDEYNKNKLKTTNKTSQLNNLKNNIVTNDSGITTVAQTYMLDSSRDGMRKIEKDTSFKKIKLEHSRALTVAVDAGHGGIDPGAKSRRGKYEKNITLMYAQSLEKELKKLGVRVIMTRNSDKTIALTNRVNIAKQAKADLFVSIHMDAHDDPKISGTTVYRLTHIDGNHPDWERFYNKSYLPRHYENYVNNRSVLDILVGMAHQTLVEKSSIIVDNTLLTFQKDNICTRCRHGQRSFAVLRGLDMLSMLIEVGYISNPTEEKKILLASNVEKFSKSLAKAIVNTFER